VLEIIKFFNKIHIFVSKLAL